MKKIGDRLGEISLLFSMLGLFGMYFIVAILDALRISLSYGEGLIFLLIFFPLGFLGLCLGVIAYDRDRKDVIGLVAFFIGVISIVVNLMFWFCAQLAMMH